MALLLPTEYNASYFDGKFQLIRHNAGYATYKRWGFNNSNNFDLMAVDILNRYSVGNKRVLEICCAKGFLVEDLVERGIDAYGVDVSPYAIGQANPSIASRLTVADIRIGQSNFLSSFNNNRFSLIIGMNCLCCFSDAEITGMITELNRISSDQFYVISENANPSFYNPKTIQQWRDSFNWEQGTVFIKTEALYRAIIDSITPQINVDFVVK